MKKRICTLVLVLMLLTQFSFCAFAEEMPEELAVGSPTAVTGNFFHEILSSNAADLDVRMLIHGCDLVQRDESQGNYQFDPSVVIGVREREDQAGNHTYYLVLADDLCYSDGTPITAWDYAFSILLTISPEIRALTGKACHAEYLLGYRDYATGRFPTLTGVSVLDDHQLVITLNHEVLPYFYEISLLRCVPYPIHVIAPGCRVYDDGYGVYIGNADPANREKIFTSALLTKTLFDPLTGYNSHPSVSSGPYVLTSFDGTTCRFELNPYYRGESGTKPSIRQISFTLADYDTMAQKLVSGELHLVNKVAYGPTILSMMQGVSQTGLRFQNYPRVGLSFVAFSHERPAVREKEVRQAIAWCMDRDRMTANYTKGFGLRVDGFYGVEQWEYLLVSGGLDYPISVVGDVIRPGESEEDYLKFTNRYVPTDEDYEDAVAAWESLTLDGLTSYSVDEEKAAALLDGAGWTLNRNGEPFRPGTDDVRCKRIDGVLIPLELTMMVPEGNHIVDTLQEDLIDHLNACGILLTPVLAPMQEVFASYYHETDRTTDMLYLATNFSEAIDPAIVYSAEDDASRQMWEIIYSDDPELYRCAVDMRETEPGDLFAYMSKWVRFQEQYNEELPSIPVYSNIYFDFYSPLLQNYQIAEHVSWAQAVLTAYWEGTATEKQEKEDLVTIEDEEDEYVEFDDDDYIEFDDDEFVEFDDDEFIEFDDDEFIEFDDDDLIEFDDDDLFEFDD